MPTLFARKKKSDYDLTHKDYTDSINSIGLALNKLQQQSQDREQADSFLQIPESAKPQEATRALAAFLQKEDQPVVEAPKAAGYEFQSNNVVMMLEELSSKFIAEKNDLELNERKKINAHEGLVAGLTAQLENAKAADEKKTGFRNTASEDLGIAKAALAQTEAELAADTKYSKELSSECKSKASDFESRKKLRGEELEALAKARGIIASDDVAGSSVEHSRLLQQSTATALASLRMPRGRPSIDGVLKQLQSQAGDLHSPALALVVEQISAVAKATVTAQGVRTPDDTMLKIKGLMQELLGKMQEQQEAEISQKGFCDKELGTNKITRADKTDAVDTLTANIDQLTTSIATLTAESADLSKQLSSIASALAEATKLRQEEKAKNKETIVDAKAAQKAVAQALDVLQDFYSKAAEATAFVQRDEAGDDEAQPRPYKGQQGASAGIIRMLEVVMEDFSRLETDTEAAEEAADNEYQDFKADSNLDKTSKETTKEQTEEKKEEQTTKLSQAEADLSSSQKELDAANEYYQELHDKCLASAVDSEGAHAKREAEIQALKDALKELSAR